MSVTLRELLETPLLKGITVLAGHRGLDRLMTSATVLDAPDGVNWLQGGELVITSGYIFRDDPLALIPLISTLNSRGMSCFAIKVSRYIGTVPDEVLHHADRLGFPLLDIPFPFAFRDVIDPVLTTVVNRQAEQLRLSETVLRSFSEIMMNGGAAKWLAIISGAAMLGCFGFLNSRTIIQGIKGLAAGKIGGGGPLYATLGGLISMMILVRISRKFPALREYNLGIAMLIGMAAAVALS